MTRISSASVSLFLLTWNIVSGVSSNTLWNAALCKPASMGSVFNYATADKAVDGNRDPVYRNGSCVHTWPQGQVENNWWMVDLEEECLVHQVVITNRERAWDRLRSMTVELFLADPRGSPSFPLDPGTRCAEINSTSLRIGTHSLPCVNPTWARFVKVTKLGSEAMNFCELEVMVSQKRGVVCFRDYLRFQNLKAQEGSIILSTATTRRPIACSVMCCLSGSKCTAFHWTEDTKSCQQLSIAISPDGYSPMSVVAGIDFYVRRGYPMSDQLNGH